MATEKWIFIRRRISERRNCWKPSFTYIKEWYTWERIWAGTTSVNAYVYAVDNYGFGFGDYAREFYGSGVARVENASAYDIAFTGDGDAIVATNCNQTAHRFNLSFFRGIANPVRRFTEQKVR